MIGYAMNFKNVIQKCLKINQNVKIITWPDHNHFTWLNNLTSASYTISATIIRNKEV